MTIGEFAREYILDEKIFIVPTRRIGLLMVNEMAISGGSALNLNPITIKRLSEDICQRYIVENNILIIDDILGKSIILDLLKTLAGDKKDFFFTENLIDDRTAEEIYNVIIELKSKHIVEFPGEKDLDLIYEAYRAKLIDLNAMDSVDITMKALEVEAIEDFKNKRIAVAGNIEFKDAERELFQALGSEIVKIRMPVKNLADSPKEYFFRDKIDVLEGDRRIKFFSEYGVRNEIGYIIADILKKELPLDQVVVAYTDKKYVEPINLEFQKAGLGISFAEGLDILSSRTYRFVKNIFDFAKEYYNINSIKPIFFNGSLNIDIDSVTSQSIYEELMRCKVFYGRENYGKLNAIPSDLDQESRLKREWIRDFFKDLIDALPEKEVDFKVYIRKLGILIKKYVKNPKNNDHNSYDKDSRDAILESLRRMEEIPFNINSHEYFQIVLSYLEEINIYRKGANPCKVFACKFSNAGYTGREHLYMIGLDSDSLANKIVESPILLDKLRREISLSLSFSKESYRYKKYKIKEALSADFKSISIGYSNFDMKDVKAKTASKIYTELKEEYGFIEEKENQEEFEGDKILRGKDLVSSASALDTLGQCSRKLYFKNRLGLKEKEEIEIDLDRWLDPLEKGNLVHEILNIFFDLAQEKRTEAMLLSIIEERSKEAQREIPYILEEVYLKEQEEIRDFCRAIIKRERTNGLEVFLNELAFGSGKKNKVFGTLKRQRVNVGSSILSISGSIDRIDIDRSSKTLKIIDYKTGNLKNFEKRLRRSIGRGKDKVFDYSQGQKFQYYIYKRALEDIIQLKEEYRDYEVESFSYEFRDGTIDLKFTADFIDEIEARIESLLELDIFENDKRIIYDGEDVLTCKYCEFKNICRSENKAIEDEEGDY